MLVFMDIEASGLIEDSYPIEIAWVFEDGSGGESHLIKPAPEWTAWSDVAEQTHNISREMLEREGEPVETVAARMIEVLDPHRIFASSPNWDQKWLSSLLVAAGHHPYRLAMQDTEVAWAQAIADALGIDMETAPRDPGEAVPRDVENIMVFAELEERHVRNHRALDDAKEERNRWLRVQEMVEERERKKREYGW